jgi:hypothetical protein
MKWGTLNRVSLLKTDLKQINLSHKGQPVDQDEYNNNQYGNINFQVMLCQPIR